MNKDQPPSHFQIPSNDLPHLPRFNIKITLPFIIINLGLALVYCFDLQKSVQFEYEYIAKGSFSGILISFFASNNLIHLIFNMFTCFILSNISERQKGSFVYLIDLVLKNIIINCISVMLYIGLSMLVNFGSFFKYILVLQNIWPCNGFQYILVLELFILIVENEAKEEYQKNEKRKFIFFKSYFLILFLFYFVQLHFIASITASLLVQFGICNIFDFLKKSVLNKNLEQKFSRFRNLLYFSHPDLNDSGFLNITNLRVIEEI